MKTVFLKGPLVLLSMILLLVCNIHAQNSTATTAKTSTAASKAQVQKPATVPEKTESKNSKKEEFVKRLNEIQPKVNDFNSKAKGEASKNPEFVAEANKLNTMTNDFRTKIDKWDTTPQDQQQEYSQSLQHDWDAIKAQHSKVESMWSKTQHTEKGEKNSSNKNSKE